eukprot:1161530-Pelagomonas_calceolata.AAC.5
MLHCILILSSASYNPKDSMRLQSALPQLRSNVCPHSHLNLPEHDLTHLLVVPAGLQTPGSLASGVASLRSISPQPCHGAAQGKMRQRQCIACLLLSKMFLRAACSSVVMGHLKTQHTYNGYCDVTSPYLTNLCSHATEMHTVPMQAKVYIAL